MGGGTFGNRSYCAEFNIWADPEAAAIVFACGAPVTMAGLDVTHQFIVTPERIATVDAVARSSTRSSPRARRPVPVLLDDLHPAQPGHGRRRAARPARGDGDHPPAPVQSSRRFVVVETHGEHTRGMTVIDRRTLYECPSRTARSSTRRRRRRMAGRPRRRSRRRPVALTEARPAHLGCPAVTDTFPRQYARTHGSRSGEPRDLVVSPDGGRVVVRTQPRRHRPVNCLWIARRRDRRGAPRRRSARLLGGGARRRPAAGGAGTPRAGPRGRRRRHHVRHGQPRSPSPRSRSRAGSSAPA